MLLRSGEILPPTQDLTKIDPQRNATFGHIAESTAENGACNHHLPWSKTQKARGDDVWIPCQEAPLDPIHAIHKHFIKNSLKLDHPIAAYRDAHDKIVTLTKSKFESRINKILGLTNKAYPHHRTLLPNWWDNILPCIRGATGHGKEVRTLALSGFLGLLAIHGLLVRDPYRYVAS
jgi:hypothetical protein